MNAEQLHATCLELLNEVDSHNLVSEIKQLAAELKQSIAQPNQPQHQVQIGSIRDRLFSSLESIASTERPVTKQQIIDEIGGSDLLGRALKERIEKSFIQLDVTPALVQNDINQIYTELVQFHAGLKQLIAGFKQLGIEADNLEGYIAELAVLIPRRENADNLEYVSKDLQKLNRELQHFNELVTGSAEPFRIRSLSSSDYTVFLQFLPETAQTVVSTIALLLFGYDKLLDIRKKRAELAEQEAPEPLIEEMDKWAESLMSKKIDQITDDLMEQFKDVERADSRSNELQGHVRMSIKKIAGRIDVGYHFSARIGAVEEPSEEDADNDELVAEYARRSEVIKNIKTKASTLEYQIMDGHPVLPLSWQPDSEEQEGDS